MNVMVPKNVTFIDQVMIMEEHINRYLRLLLLYVVCFSMRSTSVPAYVPCPCRPPWDLFRPTSSLTLMHYN